MIAFFWFVNSSITRVFVNADAFYKRTSHKLLYSYCSFNLVYNKYFFITLIPSYTSIFGESMYIFFPP